MASQPPPPTATSGFSFVFPPLETKPVTPVDPPKDSKINTTTSTTSTSTSTAGPPNPALAALRSSHATALATLSTLFDRAVEYTDESDELESLRHESELWKSSYMTAQKTVVRLESEVRALKEQVETMKGEVGQKENQSLFTAVLMDGDGLIFNDELMKQGAAGGRQAAKLLLSSLPSVISRKLPERVPMQGKILNRVVVNMYINKTGLANTLVKAGLVPSHTAFHDFFTGLSQSHDLISVVDVGPGKEASDTKIREQLRLYASNAQCGLILLGASHDNGYAPILSSLQTEGRLSNVLLLKGYSSVAFELQQYKALTVEIPGLFRSEKVGGVGGYGGAASAVWQGTPKTGVGASAKKAKNKVKLVTDEAITPRAGGGGVGSGKAVATPSKVNRGSSASDPAYSSVDTDEGDSDYLTDEVIAMITGKPTSEIMMKEDVSRWLGGSGSEGGYDDDSDVDLGQRVNKLKLGEGKTPSPKSTTKTPKKSTPQKDFTFNMKLTETSGWVGVKTPKAGSSSSARAFSPLVGGAARGGTVDEVFGSADSSPSSIGRRHPKFIKVEGSEHTVRTLNPRPCHKEYLTEEGCSNPACQFGHNYELTRAQLALLKKLVKEMPCPFLKIGRCQAAIPGDCIYGHVCPHKDTCKWQPNCRFGELPGGGH